MNKKRKKEKMDRKIVELLRAGTSYRKLMKLCQIGTGRLKKIVAYAQEHGYLDATKPLPVFPEALFPGLIDRRATRSSTTDQDLVPQLDWIKEQIKKGLSPITIYETLPKKCSKASFYRFLKRSEFLKEETKRVIPEIVHEPGEALLVDWGKLRDVQDPVTQKKRCLWAFVAVLGYSRYMMVRLVWSNTLKETLNAITSMLCELGGVPERITTDNPKCFATTASQYEAILNPTFQRFAAHYRFEIECLPPADPQKKGKVERLMPYVRRLFEGYEFFQGLEHAQLYLEEKIHTANMRIHGSTRKEPYTEFLQQEANKLKALPPLHYSVETVSYNRVQQDGHVRFLHKGYSVPPEYIGKEVHLIANDQLVNIYHAEKRIASHEKLLAEDSRTKSTQTQHRPFYEQNMQDCEELEVKATIIGPDCLKLVQKILHRDYLRKNYLDIRKVWGIFSLEKTYTKEQINKACKMALLQDCLGYQAIKKILDSDAVLSQSQVIGAQKPAIAKVGRFVRPMSVYKKQAENSAVNKKKEGAI